MKLDAALAALDGSAPLALEGRVTAIVGLVLRARLARVRVGDLCVIDRDGAPPLRAEVVGFSGDEATLIPLGDPAGVGPDSGVRSTGRPSAIRCGDALLGRVLDGLGDPIDGGGAIDGEEWPIDRAAPDALARRRIRAPLATGMRAIDGLATLGEGQRVAVLAGPGAGKSTLLAQIARSAAVDAVVVALVGERGREVREFIEDGLGAECRRRAVVVVATSDAPALVRLRAAHVATAVAEHFRERGRRVLLLVDSLTRYARAQREVGLAAGEPPVRMGFPTSVFTMLPRLLERAGASERGSITGLYAVLASADDRDDPIADEAMALLDGHLVLDPRAAAAGRFPALDVARSLSRVMPSLVDEEHLAAAARVRDLCATLAEKQDLLAAGAYRAGGDPVLDRALAKARAIEGFLRQGPGERVPLDETRRALRALASGGC
ncbi:MAG: FliI/YscN family ATPase [Myxococcota bacterium]